MAMGENGRTSYRVASKPRRRGAHVDGRRIAGGIQPWWHHVGAYHEDRRMYHTAGAGDEWHKANEVICQPQTGSRRRV
jgi:hypothetical protein